MPEANSGYDLVFHCSALAPDDLQVRRISGRDGLSTLFEYEVIVETTFGGGLEPAQLEDIIAGTSYLAFGAAAEHKVHGVVRQIEMLSMADPTPVVYRMRFVPKFFDTTLTYGSWIFQDLSVPEIIKDVLDEAGFTDDDYELRLTGSYTKSEYTVQYAESDFDFINRLAEHEGIYYFYEHGEDRAKIVFVDANTASQPLAEHETIQYDPRAGRTDAVETISALSHVFTQIPKTVKLRDYNYRTPSVQLVSESDVDAAGVGMQVFYGDHFKDLGAGRRLARIRAQEMAAQKHRYQGVTRVRGLRPGHKFTLENHMLSALDQEYLVTEMTFSAEQAGLSTAADAGPEGYTVSFVAIPHAVQFRPRRLTPKPRIYGVIQGKIDAEADGDRVTPLDDHGRYKVLMPFDVGGEGGGRASRWIRMCQSASGGGYGMHFPLHVGAEVLLIHIDGDPDRPVIVGSVPNHETLSPVTRANASQSKIATRHGITVTMDDQS